MFSLQPVQFMYDRGNLTKLHRVQNLYHLWNNRKSDDITISRDDYINSQLFFLIFMSSTLEAKFGRTLFIGVTTS